MFRRVLFLTLVLGNFSAYADESRATYHVPVPAHLAERLTGLTDFAVEPTLSTDATSPELASFKLPAALVGVVADRGVVGARDCSVDASKRELSCELRYAMEKKYELGAKEFIEKEFQDRPELEARMKELSRAFSGDPIGILRIRLTPVEWCRLRSKVAQAKITRG